MPLIAFYNAGVKPTIANKRLLKKFIAFVFSNEEKKLQSVTFIFCSDEHLLLLNKQHLNHDFYTDILTFDLSVDKNIISEIYISVDRVLENSKSLIVSFQDELLRIIIHGVLHLCDYSDKSIVDKKEMTAKEDEYLNKFASFHVKPKNKNHV